jgi:hypothetical protein
MSNPVSRLNAAQQGCYAIERELAGGGVATGGDAGNDPEALVAGLQRLGQGKAVEA